MGNLYSYFLLLILLSCAKKEEVKIDVPEKNITKTESENLNPQAELDSTPIQEKESPQKPEIIENKKLIDSNFLESFSFQIDTVLIDSKGTLIYLPLGILNSDLSENKTDLYALNSKTNTLYQFDLDKFEIINSFKFEKEGPNGVPTPIWKFQLLENNNPFFADYRHFGTYNFQGQKLNNNQINEDKFPSLVQFGSFPIYESLSSSLDGNHIYFLNQNLDNKKITLGIYDIERDKSELIELPKFDFLTNLVFIYSEGISHHVSNTSDLGIKMEKSRAIIYSKGTSKIYLYNLLNGYLEYKEPKHQLVANDQIPPFSNDISSIQEVIDANESTRFQIAYQAPLYDDQREIYFRFGSILEKTENLNPKSKSEVFLFAYDKNFNLLSETKIDDLSKSPTQAFFKDGQLWSYVNIDDELGFAVFTFDF